MDILTWAALSTDEQKAALQRSPLIGDSGLEQRVRAIVDAVASRGDAALKEFNQKFDSFNSANIDSLRLSESEISAASARVSTELKAAIAQAMANIDVFHSAQQFRPIEIETQAG
ncbi:MAG: histidinol dehydrogenase, partial [Shewanella xiamenensis]